MLRYSATKIYRAIVSARRATVPAVVVRRAHVHYKFPGNPKVPYQYKFPGCVTIPPCYKFPTLPTRSQHYEFPSSANILSRYRLPSHISTPKRYELPNNMHVRFFSSVQENEDNKQETLLFKILFCLAVYEITAISLFVYEHLHNKYMDKEKLKSIGEETDLFFANYILPPYDYVDTEIQPIHYESCSKKFPYSQDGIIIIDGGIKESTWDDFIYQYHQAICGNMDDHICSIKKSSIPITIIIRSTGGACRPTRKIINVLQQHKGHITCYIHEFANSCGTMIAFCANTVRMKPNYYVSPIDAQISLDEMNTSCIDLKEKKTKDFIHVSEILVFKRELSSNYVQESIKKIKESNEPDKLLIWHEPVFTILSLITFDSVRWFFHKHNITDRLKKIKFCKLFLNDNVSHYAKFQYDDIKDLGLNIDVSPYESRINKIIRDQFLFFYED
ncbi:MAG: hypothetical protein Edafosvirus1_130 [Edafosvirus sp.]|uniref:Uncharacterized protein n=1 Tax=Edafosvirus sp. TaxID=2487765 RepID=A0A3G4ZWK0_9VIRU|nr:MAG: hypothetical protein Edafosvirus1_130 [Edafosvirus sp.]